MNKLDHMNIADLSDEEIQQLTKYEQEMNSLHHGEELYLLVLKK